QVLDVCLANSDRAEAADMERFMAQLTRKVKVPLMIDSTDAVVIELALRHCQGQAIVNSINLESGVARVRKLVHLLRTYGATAGREDLNAVSLYRATKAGLDYAIVNTERLERYPSIPEEERRLAEDLVFGRGADPVAAFAAYFREKKKAPPAASTLSLDERLARYIVEGSRDGLIDDLNAKLKVPPEELIAAYRAHKPDAFGLSGLLVKSAQQMVVTAQDLRAAGIDLPLFVGGAALTRKFTATRIAPEYGGVTLYAKDAMDGLDL